VLYQLVRLSGIGCSNVIGEQNDSSIQRPPFSTLFLYSFTAFDSINVNSTSILNCQLLNMAHVRVNIHSLTLMSKCQLQLICCN